MSGARVEEEVMFVDTSPFRVPDDTDLYRETYFVEACCGDTRIYQNLLKPASMTVLHDSVFKRCLLNTGVWDPELSHEADVDFAISQQKMASVKVDDDVFKARGPFSVPISIDGVWVYQQVVVTEDARLAGSFVLGQSLLRHKCLQRAVDWYGTVLLDENSSTGARIVNGEYSIQAKALMDTGAGPNVMTEGLWRKLGSPSLQQYDAQLYAADTSSIDVLGKTAPLKTTLGNYKTMTVSYLVIPQKGNQAKNHLILGRDFTTQYHVLVDLIRGEARIYQPNGSPYLAVSMIAEDGSGKPFPLRSNRPKKEISGEVREVMMTEEAPETDDGMSYDSDEPEAPPAQRFLTDFLSSPSLPMDDPTWEHLLRTRDMPPTDHFLQFLTVEEKNQLRGIIVHNLLAFASDKCDLGCTHLIEHKIDLVEGAKPHKETLRRLNPEKQRQADEQVQALLELGVIEPAQSPWASGIVMAKKIARCSPYVHRLPNAQRTDSG